MTGVCWGGRPHGIECQGLVVSNVKRRFYRSDPARGIPGNGLGLAIVSAIARLHVSELELTDGPAGTGCRAVMTLPTDKAPPPVPSPAKSRIHEPAPPST